MDNKYIKVAVILVIASFIIVTMVFAVIVLAVRGPEWLGK
jgi:t-SNARE complex subunit (syntaxin)